MVSLACFALDLNPTLQLYLFVCVYVGTISDCEFVENVDSILTNLGICRPHRVKDDAGLVSVDNGLAATASALKRLAGFDSSSVFVKVPGFEALRSADEVFESDVFNLETCRHAIGTASICAFTQMETEKNVRVTSVYLSCQKKLTLLILPCKSLWNNNE